MKNRVSKVFTKVTQIIYIIWSTIYTVMVAFSVIVLLGFVLDKVKGGEGSIYGYKPAIVLTESMTPTIQRSSIIIGKEVDSIEDVEEEDIVTFKLNENGRDILITHRVVEVDRSRELLQTKGDANNTKDFFGGEDWMPMEQVVYKIVHINNRVSPLVNSVRNNPINIVYIIMFVVGAVIVWGIVKGELYKEEYELELKRGVSEDNE